MTPISALVPNAADLLALEVEEAAAVLLTHLNSYKQGDSAIMQHGCINQKAFFDTRSYYLDEQTFRYNERKATDCERFAMVLGSIAGKRLTWDVLTAQEVG